MSLINSLLEVIYCSNLASNYNFIRFIRFVSRFIGGSHNAFFISSRFKSPYGCRKKNLEFLFLELNTGWVRFRGRPATQPKATASWQRLGRRMPPGCPLEQQRSAHLLVACQVGRSAGGAAVPAVHAAAGGAGEPKGGRPAAAVVMKQRAGPERIALRPLPLDRPPSINFRARRKWPEQG